MQSDNRERTAGGGGSVAKYGVVALALAVIGAATIGTVVVLLSPSTSLPVGISIATGDSMGESVPQIVMYGPAGDLEAGDVAVFDSSEGWLRHELVRKTADGWITKGSAEPHADQWARGDLTGIEPVERSQIAGVTYVSVGLFATVYALVGALAAIGGGLLFSMRSRWTPRARRELDAIGSEIRVVTSRLSGVEARSVALTLMVVMATFTGSFMLSVGPLPFADRAEGASGQLIEDFEDASNVFGVSTTTDSYKGDKAGVFTDGTTYNHYDVGESVDSLTFAVEVENIGDAGTNRPGFTLKNPSGSTIFRIGFGVADDATPGSVYFRNPTGGYSFESTGVNATNNYVVVELSNIDYGSDTYDFSIYDDGSKVFSKSDVPFAASTDSISNFDFIKGTNQAWHMDEFRKNGSVGQTVSGTLTDSEGSAIAQGTVELEQAGTVVKTATTNSTGYYEFGAVSSGDYTVKATASGYQSKETSLSVSGAPRTVDLTLYESGTFSREFQLGEEASKTYPPSMATLNLYRFDRAIEFPLPDGTTLKAGPGDWNKVESTDFNGYGKATARLSNGEPYRVEVVATSGDRTTRWESLGWRADKDEPDPYLITLGSSTDTTPTATGSPTPTGTATSSGKVTPSGPGGVSYPGVTYPTDPFDLDGDGEYFDAPDGSGGNVSAPSGGDGFGPRIAGECTMADGSTGLLIEYWDPAYETTSLTFNVSHANSSYAGERTFETPVGYSTWCVSDSLSGNASDATDGALSGNYTQNGSVINYTDTLDQSGLFGGPIGGGGGGGEPSSSQRVIGIGIAAGVGYLMVRRFTDFRISSALSGVVDRLPVGGGR
jgi:hypothetical protein